MEGGLRRVGSGRLCDGRRWTTDAERVIQPLTSSLCKLIWVRQPRSSESDPAAAAPTDRRAAPRRDAERLQPLPHWDSGTRYPSTRPPDRSAAHRSRTRNQNPRSSPRPTTVFPRNGSLARGRVIENIRQNDGLRRQTGNEAILLVETRGRYRL